MDRRLLNKYFRDECTEEELDKVLDWFQTEEGQEYLEQDLDRLGERRRDEETPLLYSEIDSEKIFGRIQLSKKKERGNNRWYGIRVASILLLMALLSSLVYWSGVTTTEGDEDAESAFTTYVTESKQQKVFTLSDGTRIRLNEGAKLIVPEKMSSHKRQVELKGEAYFEVAHDERPFMVETAESVVEVLGTKFNVKADSAANNVQVAVIEGKVALKSGDTDGAASALLTRDNFGMLRLSDSQITIEKGNTENYVSWFNKRLIFSGESLQQVSRQLERLYDINIEFNESRIKRLKLTADIEKIDLKEVLTTISNTFDISFNMEGDEVVWME